MDKYADLDQELRETIALLKHAAETFGEESPSVETLVTEAANICNRIVAVAARA